VSDDDILIKALRKLPAPEPRPGFVDEALAKATAVAHGTRGKADPRHALLRPQIWFAAAAGAVIAAALTWFLMQPLAPGAPRGNAIALKMNESRNIDVLIESDRELQAATIRITLTGGVVLDGFDDQRQIDWQADVERGANVISLPVVARNAGAGRLVAVIEHGGKTRTVTVNLTVNDTQASKS
jgi:hypothetical protein